MKKDICCFYPSDIASVFNAYQSAIAQKFTKSIQATPYHTISFPLAFSFKYNMNGGACTVHLMPHNDGTAVNVRYSVVQLVGARCKKHNQDMTAVVEKLLGVSAQEIQLDVETFLSAKQLPECKPDVSKMGKFCVNCGAEFSDTAMFCSKCGTKRR